MSRTSNPLAGEHLWPVSTKAVQSGRVLTGEAMQKMAAMVAAANVREAAHRMSYAWIMNRGGVSGAPTCPYADIVAVETDYDVVFDNLSAADVRCDIPWLMQDGFDQIRVIGTVAHPPVADGTLAIRASAVTMITAITSAVSPYVQLQGDAPMPSQGQWVTCNLRASTPRLLSSFDVTLAPTAPADNLVSLMFEVRQDRESADPGGTVAIRAELFSLYVSNIISDLEDD